jgi:predicted PurR-regulated permease PerM
MGGRPKLASFVIVILFLIIIILPTGILIGSLVDEVKDLKASYDNGTLTIPPPSENVKNGQLSERNCMITGRQHRQP